ncbi:MAG: DUF4160 domain-containing protein [Chitinispirillaceae bacterium]
MPVISEFYGIKIMMFWNDHEPPHFHAEYGGGKVLVDIENGTVIRGVLPFKQVKLVLAWCEIHKNKLLECWGKVKIYQNPSRVDPLV